jgi:hypothetical protein
MELHPQLCMEMQSRRKTSQLKNKINIKVLPISREKSRNIRQKSLLADALEKKFS